MQLAFYDLELEASEEANELLSISEFSKMVNMSVSRLRYYANMEILVPASRIIDQLASVGLLGPFRDGKAREILLTLEEFRFKFGGGADSPWDEDDDGDGGFAGLRDDEREPEQLDWGDEDEE